jgi:lysine 2,3-aminomutase
VPSPREAANVSGYELEDPLEEDKDAPVPGLTHRYPDRALLVTTHVCTMYCRFCTRKRATMVRGGWDAVSRNDERMIGTPSAATTSAWSSTSAATPRSATSSSPAATR